MCRDRLECQRTVVSDSDVIKMIMTDVSGHDCQIVRSVHVWVMTQVSILRIKCGAVLL
ncbi:hypothetical protein KDH_19100 [Dictyobacter sp. S3.2.2.5]|uniref:Uncharacterized protein n=1 Tax=Dictyobacter halimunensis TaxID=3026934 RepID=A0ABQ6FLC0_9CHLR|nr:hypothetical protein KDH_19100 [Dictyobacter sp. S3.2.2.5]